MSDDKQANEDEKVPPPPPGGLKEESSVIALLESQSATGDLSAAATAVVSDDGDSKQPATYTDKAQESDNKIPLAKSLKESDGVTPASLEISAAVAAASQPGAFPVDGIASASSPYRSFTSPQASSPPSPPLPASRRERTEVLVSAELVDPEPTHVVADVEVGLAGTVVEAKPLVEKEDQPIRLIDLWKNRSVRIIAIVIFLIIVGLIVGLVVGLQQSTRPIDTDEKDDDGFQGNPPKGGNGGNGGGSD
jgi:hypothetical protein